MKEIYILNTHEVATLNKDISTILSLVNRLKLKMQHDEENKEIFNLITGCLKEADDVLSDK